MVFSHLCTHMTERSCGDGNIASCDSVICCGNGGGWRWVSPS